jgi:hypothetical protein
VIRIVAKGFEIEQILRHELTNGKKDAILEKYVIKIWIGFIWLRMGTNGGGGLLLVP